MKAVNNSYTKILNQILKKEPYIDFLAISNLKILCYTVY